MTMNEHFPVLYLNSSMHHCTLAGPLNWLFLPLLPEREPDPGLEPELGLEPVLPLELCSHSSCRVERRG